MPTLAPIDRAVSAQFRAHVQDVLVERIFAYHVDRLAGQIALDRLPGLSVIG